MKEEKHYGEIYPCDLCGHHIIFKCPECGEKGADWSTSCTNWECPTCLSHYACGKKKWFSVKVEMIYLGRGEYK